MQYSVVASEPNHRLPSAPIEAVDEIDTPTLTVQTTANVVDTIPYIMPPWFPADEGGMGTHAEGHTHTHRTEACARACTHTHRYTVCHPGQAPGLQRMQHCSGNFSTCSAADK